MLSASQDLNLAPSLHQSAALPTELDAVATSGPGGIRTLTDMLLRHVPLPLGYRTEARLGGLEPPTTGQHPGALPLELQTSKTL